MENSKEFRSDVFSERKEESVEIGKFVVVIFFFQNYIKNINERNQENQQVF